MSWIKIPRTLLQECNNDSVTVHLFLHLLITSDGSGAVTTTLSKLAEELRTTVDKIRTRLAKLESVGLIEIPQSSHKNPIKIPRNGTVVSVCNYESYAVFDLGQSHKNPIKIPRSSHNAKETNKEKVSPIPPIKENKKESLKESCRFLPPTVQQVQEYIQEKGYAMSAERFHDFYTSKNWYVGRNKMKDWRAAVRNWASRDNNYGQKSTTTSKAEYMQSEKERLMREIIAASRH